MSAALTAAQARRRAPARARTQSRRSAGGVTAPGRRDQAVRAGAAPKPKRRPKPAAMAVLSIIGVTYEERLHEDGVREGARPPQTRRA